MLARLLRLASFSGLWFIFWAGSSYAAALSMDVAGPLWAAGIYGFPLMATLYLAADLVASRYSWPELHPWRFVAAATIVSMVLYYPMLYFVVRVYIWLGL